MRPCLLGLTIAVLLSGCALRSPHLAERDVRAANPDEAVERYERALRANPDRLELRAALERATFQATWSHVDAGRALEARGMPAAALAQYRRAIVYDPSNERARDRIAAITRGPSTGARPARDAGHAESLAVGPIGGDDGAVVDPSREALRLRFRNASLRDVLDLIGEAADVNVLYDDQFQDREVSIALDGLTLEEALDLILRTHGYFAVVPR